ncbi:hypothetical protein IDH44_00830 [Paenibacillus sp. IB182496]|uniref:DoxX family protein n=2 Tax=Paenibacillus sabuli TaxID=2772509 RepID=A0A927GPQ4_9BACL|nr:hypothetical protein [Paenibacillus sabuli]
MRSYRTTVPRAIALVLFSVFFAAACAYHFREAEGFAAMLPSFVPWRLEIVYVTGGVELLLAVLIQLPAFRRRAGNWTAIYLILIFPANIYAAIAGVPAPGQEETSAALLWGRLAFQPLIIWWVWWATRLPRSGKR